MNLVTSDPVQRFRANYDLIRGKGSEEAKKRAWGEMNATIREASPETLSAIARLGLWGKGFQQTKKNLEDRQRILVAIHAGRSRSKRVVVV